MKFQHLIQFFFDEDGDTPDWIEIYNYGEQNISLLDWSISDSENDNTLEIS